MWLIGMIFLITSSLLGSVNSLLLLSIAGEGAQLSDFRSLFGRSWSRRSCCCSRSAAGAAGVLQLMDRVAGTVSSCQRG
jgi:hypothetical protein